MPSMQEAYMAADLERLRDRADTAERIAAQNFAEIERLRAALDEIRRLFDSEPAASEMARAALEPGR